MYNVYVFERFRAYKATGQTTERVIFVRVLFHSFGCLHFFFTTQNAIRESIKGSIAKFQIYDRVENGCFIRDKRCCAVTYLIQIVSLYREKD